MRPRTLRSKEKILKEAFKLLTKYNITYKELGEEMNYSPVYIGQVFLGNEGGGRWFRFKLQDCLKKLVREKK